MPTYFVGRTSFLAHIVVAELEGPRIRTACGKVLGRSGGVVFDERPEDFGRTVCVTCAKAEG